MKNLLFIAVGMLLSIQAANAQTPLNKIKLDGETEKKISNTAVGWKVEEGKKSNVNTKMLATEMPNGEKIISYKIVYWKAGKTYYLSRKFLIGKTSHTSFIPLKQSGNSFIVDLNSKRAAETCTATDCDDCGEYLAGSGTSVCACGGETGSCTNPGQGIMPGDKKILETLFN